MPKIKIVEIQCDFRKYRVGTARLSQCYPKLHVRTLLAVLFFAALGTLITEVISQAKNFAISDGDHQAIRTREGLGRH